MSSTSNSTRNGGGAPRTSFKFGVASSFPVQHQQQDGHFVNVDSSLASGVSGALGNGREGTTVGQGSDGEDRYWGSGGGSPAAPILSSRYVKAETAQQQQQQQQQSVSVVLASSGGGTQEAHPSGSQPPALPPQGPSRQANEPASSSLPLPTASCDAVPSRLKGSAELASVLAGLDDSQRAAVCFDPAQPLLIQAGAGSGKTQTMASRIAFLLLCGVPSRRILGICFTRQAAETLRQRVRAVLPVTLQGEVGQLTLKTLHSFGLQCLRRFGVMAADTEVYDAAKQRKLARRIVEQYAVHSKGVEAVDALVEYVNKAKTKKDLPAAQFSPTVQEGYLFRFYEAALHDEERAVDFGDLQRLFLDILRPVREALPSQPIPNGHDNGGNHRSTTEVHGTGGGEGADVRQQPPQQPTASPLRPSHACETLRRDYTHIVVDEVQDFNAIQFEILTCLAGDSCRVTCVGDANQCIYEWRGAMPNVFQAWKRRFPKTVLRALKVNYRSGAKIVSALNGLVHSCQEAHCHRHERKPTLVRCETEDDVLDAVPFIIEKLLRRRDPNSGYSDVAVLCRSRRRVQAFCDALASKNIPVRELKGVSPDGISIVRALLAYLKLSVRPDLDSEVCVALSSGPRHLPVRQSKKLFFGIAAMAAERREQATAAGPCVPHSGLTSPFPDSHCPPARLPSPSSSLLCSPSGTPISSFSYYAVLSDAAFHDFSDEAYPKLQGLSKAQCKMIKHFLAVIREAHDRLYRPPHCDVADLIRTIAREGGFESEDPVTVDGNARTVAAATSRKRRRMAGGSGASPAFPRGSGRRGRASGSLAEDAAAEYNSSQQRQRGAVSVKRTGEAVEGEEEEEEEEEAAARGRTARRAPKSARPSEADDDGLPSAYTAEEEAALLATSRVSVTELLLCAYEDVMEAIRMEEEEEGVEEGEESSGHRGEGEKPPSGSVGPRPTPAAILRRVIDQFVTLLPSDDFGSLRTLSNSHATTAVTTMETKEEGDDDDQQQQQQQQRQTGLYPHGHLQTTALNKVTVSTVHKAKGMEWPSVIIPDCWVGEFPTGRQDQEERRVFYVAMSRAMTNLFLVTARTSDDSRYTRSGANRCSGGGNHSPAGKEPQQQGTAGALVQTPYLEQMKGQEVEEVEYTALRAAALQARGAW